MEMEDKRKECCRQLENLLPHQERPDLIINICKICGCRHFELTLAVGQLGLRGGNIGG